MHITLISEINHILSTLQNSFLKSYILQINTRWNHEMLNEIDRLKYYNVQLSALCTQKNTALRK